LYDIKYTSAAEKYFRKIKEKGLREAFSKALNEISSDPYIGEKKRGDLAGIVGFDVYYNKTNYEIAYRIYEQHGQLVVVILAGTRENFYNEIKRYMK
jgi:mRNA interferase RelE/StbE